MRAKYLVLSDKKRVPWNLVLSDLTGLPETGTSRTHRLVSFDFEGGMHGTNIFWGNSHKQILDSAEETTKTIIEKSANTRLARGAAARHPAYWGTSVVPKGPPRRGVVCKRA